MTVTIGRAAALAAILFWGVSAALSADPSAWEKRIEAGRNYWAFQPPAKLSPPPAASAWVRTDVDAYIFRQLSAKGLQPSPQLGKERLLRRVYLDLIGLPPTPEEAAAFLDDRSPRAYENLVERLLASPHYGERWALKWLDVVRYADTNGFETDEYRAHAWRYRDYVVRSFNNDKPFDRFVQEQIAGDELFPGDTEPLIATGFHGAGPRHLVSGNQDKEEARQEVLTEMTLGVGQVFLALTVQCARCHDHKFDPIAQADYYRLQAFFAGAELKDLDTAPLDERAASDRAAAAHKTRLEPIEAQIEQIEKPFREQAIRLKTAKLDPHFREAFETPKERRSVEQERLAKEAEGQVKPMWYEVLALIPDDIKARRSELRRQMHAINLEQPDPAAAAFAVANQDEAPTTHILKIGDYRHKQGAVEPGFPSVLETFGIEVPENSAGRRAALARWLTVSDNPLPPRVMVNRIWEFRMGRGLVADPNNFGLLGGTPSHPELLDYLARRFVEFGWSVKAIDRMIILSNAYRQSSEMNEQNAVIDPDNRLYWRANRRRLEGEAIRDSILAASGRLNRSLGGKPVRIPIEPEIYDVIFTEAEPDNLWPVTPDESQHRRRSIYLLNRRTVRLPFLTNFDQPDTMTSCAVRSNSTHALQALTMLNSEFMQVESGALADRLQRDCAAGARDCVVELAYALTLARRRKTDRWPPNNLISRPARSRSSSSSTSALRVRWTPSTRSRPSPSTPAKPYPKASET